jgi:hypothetical protein
MMLFAGAPILLIKGISSINRVLKKKKRDLPGGQFLFFCLDDPMDCFVASLPRSGYTIVEK